MIVYLVGMPGAGKSRVGRELAGRLGVPFLDLDSEIEAEAGSAVALVLADAVLEKFGGDSLPETQGNLRRYLEGLT